MIWRSPPNRLCWVSCAPPSIVNPSQFTNADFTGLLLNNEIAISMDGKGAWRDNVFVERLWRTIAYTS